MVLSFSKWHFYCKTCAWTCQNVVVNYTKDLTFVRDFLFGISFSIVFHHAFQMAQMNNLWYKKAGEEGIDR